MANSRDMIGAVANGDLNKANDIFNDVMAAKPGGPIMQAAAASAAATPAAKDKTLVVQVMLNGRQVGEAIRPHIQREILGTA